MMHAVHTVDAQHFHGACTRLADFICAEKEQIYLGWLKAVHENKQIRRATEISDSLLVDHVPELLDNAADVLRSPSDALLPSTAIHYAQVHGEERFTQGFALDEMLYELAEVRTTLIENIVRFVEENPQFTQPERAAAIARIHRFLDEIMRCSTVRFVEEQQRKLKEADDARLRLIRTVSHELRNIINGIGLTAQTVEACGKELIDQLPELLGRNVQHMREILDDLLQLSALSSGAETVRLTRFSLGRLLREIELTYRPMAEAKHLKFTSGLDATLDQVVSDELKTKQIAANLVSNAVKYTNTGTIRVEFRTAGTEKWAIVVMDTGIGVSEAHREQIFSEFYRVEETSHADGMGLGLAIVSRLVHLLDGEMRLDSEEGKGSRFEVILPKTFPHSDKATSFSSH